MPPWNADSRSIPLAASFYTPRVTRRRALCVCLIAVATLVSAFWILTYEVTTTYEYFVNVPGPNHSVRRHFDHAQAIREQPWWSVYATLGVFVTGLGISMWLLPDRPRLIKRFANSFAKPS